MRLEADTAGVVEALAVCSMGRKFLLRRRPTRSRLAAGGLRESLIHHPVVLGRSRYWEGCRSLAAAAAAVEQPQRRVSPARAVALAAAADPALVLAQVVLVLPAQRGTLAVQALLPRTAEEVEATGLLERRVLRLLQTEAKA